MVLIIIRGTIYLLVVGPGIVGNTFIFVNYLCIFIQDTEKKFIHLILLQLTFINIMILFCNGLEKTITIFRLRNFQGDTGCQIIVFLERMGRGLSICTTSLLTVVQAIIMSPRSSMWARFKPRSAWHLFPFFFCFWILSCLTSIHLLYYIRNISSLNKSVINNNYCILIKESQKTTWIFLTLLALHDGLFQILMGWASVYILLLLHKHHQRVLYLRNSSLVPKPAPEIRAAQSVLLLMFCFVLFYWTETVGSLYYKNEYENQTIALNVLEIFSVGYASLSPFVMIHRDVQLVSCWHTFTQPKGNY